ncbi:MAG: hypothetical protein JXQ25_05720 [Deltaproteobacteria bacterium]|nr:hypothetical protein [Deltaproteobacteria bacterium]
MAITPGSYFSALRDYLNREYKVTEVENDKVVIKDKIYLPGSTTESVKKVRLQVPGEALVINLDLKNRRGNSDPLFHFLEDNSKPWAKRCDFVIFHLHRKKITAICIEFKSRSFPDSLIDQMKAGVAWCRSLHSVIKHYTSETKRIRITKFVLSCHQSPDVYLDNENKYLLRDHTIRHYHYDDIDGMSLDELENKHVETIG